MMGETKGRSDAAFEKINDKIDMLCTKISAMDTMQKHMEALLELSPMALQKADQHQHDTTLHFAATNQRFDASDGQVDLTAAAVTRLQRDQIAATHGEIDTDPSSIVHTGQGILKDLPGGFQPGANAGRGACSHAGGGAVGGGDGGCGGGRTGDGGVGGGAGGGRLGDGGVGGGRPGRYADKHHTGGRALMHKISFPKFNDFGASGDCDCEDCC